MEYMDKKEIVQKMIDGCCERNETVKHAVNFFNGMSLEAFLALQRFKLHVNLKLEPIQERSDFIDICTDYVTSRMDKETAAKVRLSVETGALHTADHLGGLYTPQSFQGDLLFGEMMSSECIPCFAAGSVTLHSSTYGRGIMYSGEPESMGRLPVFPGKYAKWAASLVHPFNEAAVLRTRKAAGSIRDEAIKNTIIEMLNDIYLDDGVLSQKSFADQEIKIGAEIYKRMGSYCSARPMIHIETEEISGRLFLKDMNDDSSLVYRMLSDKAVINEMRQMHNGMALGELLFRGNDKNGHMFPLALTEDGYLRGTTIRNEEISFKVSPESLSKAVSEKRIFVSGYLRALMLAFARGFTWYGGIFQSVYLSRWQQATATVLSVCGYEDLSRRMSRLDASGYISGPVFVLYDNGTGAAPAGPVEFMLTKPDKTVIQKLLRNTTVSHAHIMGMPEFYYDLFSADERIGDWYEKLTAYSKANFMDNIIMPDPVA